MEILRPAPEENLGIQYPKIFYDRFYQKCISLAMQSKTDFERYGSLAIKGGLVIKNWRVFGEGRNRCIAHPSFGKLKRQIRQGYANHAETEGMNSALDNNHRLKGLSILVAGYFPKDDGLLFLHEEFTCTKCAKVMQKYEIDTLFVPSPTGWIPRIIEGIEVEAGRYTTDDTMSAHQKRLNSTIGHWKISDLMPMLTT